MEKHLLDIRVSHNRVHAPLCIQRSLWFFPIQFIIFRKSNTSTYNFLKALFQRYGNKAVESTPTAQTSPKEGRYCHNVSYFICSFIRTFTMGSSDFGSQNIGNSLKIGFCTFSILLEIWIFPNMNTSPFGLVKDLYFYMFLKIPTVLYLV